MDFLDFDTTEMELLNENYLNLSIDAKNFLKSIREGGMQVNLFYFR